MARLFQTAFILLPSLMPRRNIHSVNSNRYSLNVYSLFMEKTSSQSPCLTPETYLTVKRQIFSSLPYINTQGNNLGFSVFFNDSMNQTTDHIIIDDQLYLLYLRIKEDKQTGGPMKERNRHWKREL